MVTNYDLFELDRYLQNINLEKPDICLFKELMNSIIPKDSNDKRLINYNIEDCDECISFIPEKKKIEVPINKLKVWVENNKIISNAIYGCNEELNNYLLLFSIIHEVEHSYQYLIGEGKIDTNCNAIKTMYKEIMGYMINSNFKTIGSKIRRYKVLKRYDKYHDSFFIERNANLEASATILQLALLNENENAIDFFRHMLAEYMCQGYNKNNRGCIYHTYKSVGLLNNYNSYEIDNLTDEEKIKYGFEISEEKRLVLLEKRNIIRNISNR